MVVTSMIDLNTYGLQLVRVDLPFRLNHVNCFLAENETGWTLIDTGLYNEETKNMWDDVLKKKEITEIIVTHEHPDHIGSAGFLQNKYEVEVYMSKTTYESSTYFLKEERLSNLQKSYKMSGVPSDVINKLLKENENMKQRVHPLPIVNRYLVENELVSIGEYQYEIIFTPGHADGLITLFNKEHNVLISTDHILPKITPNISYWFHGDPNPLKTYIESLNKIKKLDAEVVIPSHGYPFYNANERIDEIIAHHDERLNMTLEIVKHGGTVYDMTNKMFNKKLTSHEMRFAIGETIAHLEYLKYKGECTREEINGVWSYMLT